MNTFVRVTPSKIQVSLGKGVLELLDSPPYLGWQWRKQGKSTFIRLVVLTEEDVIGLLEGSDIRRLVRIVTYCKGRPTALSTIPQECRKLVKGGTRYDILRKGTKGKWIEWVEFSPSKPKNLNIQEVRT